MLDVKRMRVLREIAAQGSFSAAADVLYLSQSAVSQHMAALEREVGQKLVERTSGGPHLTQAGEVLVSHADAVLARLDEAERELSALAGLRGGRLRVASFPTASATLLTTAMSRFAELYPEVRLELREAEPEESVPQLKQGVHDLALVYSYEALEQPEDRDLQRHLLIEDRMWLAVPKGHPMSDKAAVSLAELCDEAWLCGTCDGSCRQNVILACRAAGFDPRIAFESDDYQVLQGLIASGLGVTLLPDLALTTLHPGVAIVPVKPRAPIRHVWAATRAEGSRSPAADAMVEILREVGERYAAQTAALVAA
jgi:molybdate transport repressor ModE-like protein